MPQHALMLLYCRYSADNFNSPMCKAAKVTIVEVEEIVELGEITPNQVYLFIHCFQIISIMLDK